MEKIIVVGAGILGASTAYHLSKFGANVTVVDRFDSGQATEAAAGIICPWLTNRRNNAWYQLVKGGAKYYPELVSELESEGQTQTGFANVGAINIFDTDEKLERKMSLALERQQESPEMGKITKLSSEETRTLFPLLSDKYRAVHISGASRVDGSALRNALICASKNNGAEIIYGNASLLHKGFNVRGVSVDGQEFLADKVIVTGGIWSKKLLEPLGLDFQVTGQKAQIIHLELPATQTEKWPVVIPPYNQYILAFEKGKIVIGTTHEENKEFDSRVTTGAVYSIIDKALKVAPGLSGATYVKTKVGFRPFTPGYLPVFGPVPGINGLVIANGLGASGLTSGPYLGSEIANLVLGKRLDLSVDDYDVRKALSE